MTAAEARRIVAPYRAAVDLEVAGAGALPDDAIDVLLVTAFPTRGNAAPAIGRRSCDLFSAGGHEEGGR